MPQVDWSTNTTFKVSALEVTGMEHMTTFTPASTPPTTSLLTLPALTAHVRTLSQDVANNAKLLNDILRALKGTR